MTGQAQGAFDRVLGRGPKPTEEDVMAVYLEVAGFVPLDAVHLPIAVALARGHEAQRDLDAMRRPTIDLSNADRDRPPPGWWTIESGNIYKPWACERIPESVGMYATEAEAIAAAWARMADS